MTLSSSITIGFSSSTSTFASAAAFSSVMGSNGFSVIVSFVDAVSKDAVVSAISLLSALSVALDSSDSVLLATSSISASARTGSSINETVSSVKYAFYRKVVLKFESISVTVMK